MKHKFIPPKSRQTLYDLDDLSLLAAYKEATQLKYGDQTPCIDEIVRIIVENNDEENKYPLSLHSEAYDMVKDEMARRYFYIAQEMGVRLDFEDEPLKDEEKSADVKTTHQNNQ